MSNILTLEVTVDLDTHAGTTMDRIANVVNAMDRAVRLSPMLAGRTDVEVLGVNVVSRDDMNAGSRGAVATLKQQLAASEERCAELAGQLAMARGAA